MIDLPPPSYAQMIEAIAQCDIARAKIRVGYEDLMQSDVVTISDLGEVTDEKLRCLKAAVHPFYILTIENDAQQAAFYEFSRREDRPHERAEAIEWLRAKGWLGRLPSYDPKQGVEKFAEALEMGCGLERGSALMSYGASSLTVRPDFFLGNKLDASADALSCLTRMFTASDASEHDIRFGFIGNEAFREDDES